MSFSQRVVLVTGAGGGIGRAVANAFASEGSSVFATDLREEEVKRVEREVTAIGKICHAERLDVIDPVDVVRGVGRCVETFGRIDILVNCAGILSILPFDEITPDAWDRTMDVNARGTFLMCQSVAKEMIRQGRGGKIVNISSVAGKIGAPYYTHYCASKFAVIAITKSLAPELAKYAINVNAVCPGDVQTQMLDYEFEVHSKLRGSSVQEVKEQLTRRVPLGRLAVPDDVAEAVVFLASDAAGYITGQTLDITGGTNYLP